MKNRRHRRRPDAPQRDNPFFNKIAGQANVGAKAEDGFFQPKLKIGKRGDRFEQEADKVADAVVNRARSSPNDKAIIRKKEKIQRQVEQEEDVQAKMELQRQAKEEEEPVQAQAEQEEEAAQAQTEEEEPSVQTQAEQEEEAVQTRANEEEEAVQTQANEEEESVQTQANEEEEPVQAKSKDRHASPAFAARLKQRQGRGQPLPPKVRAEMETSLKTDFSAVRIHTDEEAAQLSEMLGAQAFTRGNDIFFNEGKFNPESSKGKHLLAHELTHTKQQRKK